MTELDVQPGWRGTDPDGGTWVLTTTGYPWWYVSADGKTWGWRSWEKAEAAALVAVVAATYVDEYRTKYEEYLREFCKAADEVDGLVEELEKARAQLDLDSPEDHERVGAFIQEFNRRRDLKAWAPIQASDMYKEAETLRRDAAEAEQEIEDEKRARQYSIQAVGDDGYWDVALTAIRGEREHKEAK